MINRLLEWKATAVVGRSASLQILMDNPQILIEIQTSGKQIIVYKIGRMGSAFYAVSSESPWVYRITQEDAEKMIPRVSGMKIID